MKRRKITLGLIILQLAALHLLATDLFLTGSGPCAVEYGILEYVKVTVRNTSDAGGGPFDSEDTIVEMDQMPNGLNPSGSIGLRGGQILWMSSSSELILQPGGIPRKMDPEPGHCHCEDQRIVCNIGRVPANETRTVRLYFTTSGEGSISYQTRVRGPLFDPDPDNNTVSGELLIQPTTKRLIYPWISNNTGQFESILVANNYGQQEAQVVLTARRADGAVETVMRTIPPAGSLIETASALFETLGSGSGYCVVLESDEQNLTGHWVSNNLMTGTGRSPSQGVAIDPSDTPAPIGDRFGNTIMFGYLPVTGDLISAPVIVNLGTGPADVILRFYNQAGDLVLEDRESLKDLVPLRPFAAVANTLVPQSSDDLYLIASSTTKLTGVAFVFNSRGEPAIGNVLGIPRSSISAVP